MIDGECYKVFPKGDFLQWLRGAINCHFLTFPKLRCYNRVYDGPEGPCKLQISNFHLFQFEHFCEPTFIIVESLGKVLSLISKYKYGAPYFGNGTLEISWPPSQPVISSTSVVVDFYDNSVVLGIHWQTFPTNST